MPPNIPRVLMIGTDLHSKGGISSVLSMYSDAGLFKRVRFLPSYTDGSSIQKIRHYAIFLIRYIWILVTDRDIQLVHVHSASYWSFMRKSLALLLAKISRRKTIIHIHGAEFILFFTNASPFQKNIIRTILFKSDAIIALSRQWRSDLKRISGNPNVRVIYNPAMPNEKFTVKRTLAHQVSSGIHCSKKEKSNNRPVRFLFMGRLGKRKGVYDIIEAARLLPPGLAHINLYGDGDALQANTLIEQYKISDSVTLCGWVEGSQKDEAFQSADVLLLPSYNEGLPVSILEAMAYGLPVVASSVGGIPDAVVEGETGYLLEPGNIHMLADRMYQLATSASLRSRMSQNALDAANRKFALPVILEQLEGLYDELIG